MTFGTANKNYSRVFCTDIKLFSLFRVIYYKCAFSKSFIFRTRNKVHF